MSKKPVRKTDRKATAAEGDGGLLPAGPDDFVKLDNRPAREKMPAKLAAQAVRRLVVSPMGGEAAGKAGGRDYAPKLRRVEAKASPAHWELELSDGLAQGLPGQDYGRLSVAEVTRGLARKADAGDGVAPHRPDWVDYTPHAKVLGNSTPLMRRIDGRLVHPDYGVFGPDDRQVYYPAGYPWHCIGKILVWNDFSQPYPAWSGSGVLIGDRVVLTCGHMAPWGSGNWAMQFIPAYYDGGSILGAGVSSWVSNYYGYNTGGQVSAWDMLVCRLYTPLGQSYGYYGTKNYSSSWQGGNYWTLAGYPGAIANANRPSRQMWWPVLDDDSDGSAEEVEYEADSSAGNSGGPVFGFWSGAPYCIATHSGGSKTTFLWWTLEDTNVGAGGGALNALVSWARNNWPA